MEPEYFQSYSGWRRAIENGESICDQEEAVVFSKVRWEILNIAWKISSYCAIGADKVIDSIWQATTVFWWTSMQEEKKEIKQMTLYIFNYLTKNF